MNPQRSIPTTYINGISSSMVASALTFEQTARTVAGHIDGATPVAYNLPFDARMLRNGFAWMGAEFDPGSGFCTYRATRTKLVDACHHLSIPLETHHRALGDARAAAQLVERLHPDGGQWGPVRVRIR